MPYTTLRQARLAGLNQWELFDLLAPGWKDKVWSTPGPRGMQLKNREEFMPGQYVRRWKEGNEEMMLHALKRFKSLQLRVQFQVMEHLEDVRRRQGRTDVVKKGAHKKYSTLRGKTVIVKKIPSQGMLMQLIKMMQDAAVEGAKR